MRTFTDAQGHRYEIAAGAEQVTVYPFGTTRPEFLTLAEAREQYALSARIAAPATGHDTPHVGGRRII